MTDEIVDIHGLKFRRLTNGELEYIWPEGPGKISVRSAPDGINEIPEVTEDTSKWGVADFYHKSKEMLGG